MSETSGHEQVVDGGAVRGRSKAETFQNFHVLVLSLSELDRDCKEGRLGESFAPLFVRMLR